MSLNTNRNGEKTIAKEVLSTSHPFCWQQNIVYSKKDYSFVINKLYEEL